MAIGATKWLTVCLHYNEPWEEFLTKAVKPYVEVVLHTGVAERFFFERSWNNGPHVQLWFKSTEFLLENMLKPNLLEHFNHYFDSKPSFLITPNYPASTLESDKWRSNNSVHFFNYEPELEMQCGRLEMSVLEKHYQASSLLVLKQLKDKQGRLSQTELTSIAIKLNLATMYAVGMTLDQAEAFATWAYQTWALEYSHHNLEGVTGNIKVLDQSFQKIFDIQRNDIVPYHSALWELFKNYLKVEDKSYVDWIHANSETNLEIELALDAGKLQPLLSNIKVPSAYFSPTWPFYANFIRKTNNRLGVLRKHEGYLLFSIAQSLQQINKGSTVFSISGMI